MMMLETSNQGYKEPTGKKLEINNLKKPNLLRELYPYSEIPKVIFDNKIVPLDPPKNFWITDTTFRDGQQARPPYSVKEITDLYKMMHRLGGPKGIIRQCEFFLYSDKDKEAVKSCQALGYKFPEVTGWIRAVPKDFELVKAAGLKETGILTSVSDYHIYLKLGWDRKKAAEKYMEVIDVAIKAEVIPRCHFEDITRADIYGFVIPFAQMLMDKQQESGIPIKIRLCDTMGYGVSYPGAALPRSIPKLVNVFVNEAKVPKEQLEIHTHNDFHKYLVNASSAWLYGCAVANGALLGYGERTGNTPVEGLCIEYASLKGSTNGMDLSVITEIGDYYREEIGEHIPKNFPFVGEDFNVTRAGIHADGTIKNEEIYNIFDTNKLLNRPLGVGITDKSGTAGVTLWIDNYFNLKDDKKIDKYDPKVKAIHHEIIKEYEQGRTTSISNHEMLKLVNKHMPDL